MAVRTSRAGVVILLVGCPWGAAGDRQGPPKPEGKPLVSATFESGSATPPFGKDTLSNGAVATVSDALAHSGKHAGYYSYVDKPPVKPTRAYPNLNVRRLVGRELRHFLIEMWVYVPSTVKAETVALTDWISFATFAWYENDKAYTAFTLDSTKDRAIQLFVAQAGRKVVQQNVQSKPLHWSFDKWFKISVEAELKGEKDSRIVVYQDDAKIIEYGGVVFPKGKGLTDAHFGLYMGGKQGAFAVYNDDLSLWELPCR